MLTEEFVKKYVENHAEEVLEVTRALCAIPAPCNGETERAKFCLEWFRKNGGENAYIDGMENVILPVHVTEDNNLYVFAAHTDTVFPDTGAYPWREEGEKIFCPSISDDTANLAVVMVAAKGLLESGEVPPCGMLFVANSGEEGLGNLKGVKQLFRDFGTRIKGFISADGGSFAGMTNGAVGSHRYRISVDTEGGHSFGAFGNRNAIHVLSSMICSLYTVKVPKKGDSRTTYNVGGISGGTTINTIAAHAEMLYEYRSDDLECLNRMKKMLEATLEAYRAMGVTVNCELLGDRPCTGDIDAEDEAAFTEKVNSVYEEVMGEPCSLHSGSTDANIPLSLGVPAVTIGLCVGGGGHTRGEWLERTSLSTGLTIMLKIINQFLK